MGPSRVRADSESDGAYPEMEVYSEVLKKVQTDYVSDPNMTKVTSVLSTACSSRWILTPAI